ncbi:MAG: aryl-alcohol dehydrogenase-like predicted oxidoreductase [Paracoccaceae bacterium]|jgi:aryl-alcohol dehydrogenase-like predicted oxidoreductase
MTGPAPLRYLPVMLKRTIPSTGEEIAAVGLGTWRGFDIGNSATERAPRRAVLETLLDAGASLVDSSPMYGRAEEVAGDLLADMGRRDEAFIATKVWTQGGRQGIREMEDSFRLLKTDTIDLMQVHNLVDWRTHMAPMRTWKAEGRLRYTGYTHYRPHAFDDLMETARTEPVDFLQFCYSIDERDAEDDILPFCAANGIATLINVPFGGGGLLSRLIGEPLPALAADLRCTSWAQFCLKYVISHPAVTCAIPGTANPAHMADLLAATEGEMPDEATRQKMAALF